MYQAERVHLLLVAQMPSAVNVMEQVLVLACLIIGGILILAADLNVYSVQIAYLIVHAFATNVKTHVLALAVFDQNVV